MRGAAQNVDPNLRALVEYSTNLFYSYGVDGTAIYVSPQSRAFFDCDPDEAKAKWKTFRTDNPTNRRAVELTRRAIATGEPQEPYELELKGVKGRVIWVEVHEAPVVQNGKTVAIVGALTDITKWKRLYSNVAAIAKGVSRDAESSFFHDLVRHFARAVGADHAFIGLVTGENNDRVDTIAVWSHGASAANFQYALDGTPCEVVMDRATCMFESGVRQRFPRDVLLQEMAIEGYGGLPLLSPDGDVLGLIVVLFEEPVTDPDLVAWTLDIFASRAAGELERQRTLEELREGRARMKRAQRLVNMGFLDWDLETNRIELSDEVVDLYGLEPGTEWIAADFVRDLVHPDDLERVGRAVAAAAAGDSTYDIDHRIVRPDGTVIWVHSQAELVAGPPKQLLGATIDVTARKETEMALRESEGKKAAILSAQPDLMFYLDRAGTHVEWAGNSADLAVRPEEFLGRTVRDVLDADVADLYETSIERCLNSKSMQRFEYELDAGGARRSYEARMVPGGDDRVMTIVRDVTAVRQAEEERKKTEEQYRSLVQHATYGIYRSTAGGKFLMVNPALVRMLGYESEEELLAVDLPDLFDDPGTRSAAVGATLDAGTVRGLEVVWKRKDGTPITILLSGYAVEGEDGEVEFFEMMAEDVSERKELEEQLRQAQKMEAIGRLTGGIAHDFNNLLTVIRGNAELASDPATTPEELLRSMSNIVAATRRGGATIRQLLGFSRKADLKVEPTDLGALVRELEPMLVRVTPEKIRLNFEMEDDLRAVAADRGSVEQMIINLVNNARDAMPEGGDLRVSITNAVLDDEYVLDHSGAEPGEYVCISVSDTGVGMTAATRRKLFEPFFTTKPVGAGTGLGMAMVYGLMKQHRGYVHVYSEPGAGTRVRLYFPATSADTAIVETKQAARLAEVGGGETILLVEDEDDVRSIGRRVLERYGYEVIPASDGVEALEIYRAKRGAIDLVLSDTVMPHMGGVQLYRELCQEQDPPRFVLCSGYRREELSEIEDIRDEIGFLEKPWEVKALLEKVRTELGKWESGR